MNGLNRSHRPSLIGNTRSGAGQITQDTDTAHLLGITTGNGEGLNSRIPIRNSSRLGNLLKKLEAQMRISRPSRIPRREYAMAIFTVAMEATYKDTPRNIQIADTGLDQYCHSFTFFFICQKPRDCLEERLIRLA